MLRVTLPQVVETLKAVGLKRGDGVMAHSATQFLGVPVGGPGMYYEALCEVLGLGDGTGTLVVPAFNFGFAHGLPFDQKNTPSDQMGALSEYVRLQPEARRTSHPMHSLAAVGEYADELASIDTSGAFDPGSAFERMVDLDFKLLLLGADVYYATMIHYCERRAEVPYRYWKDFTGEVSLDGQPPRMRTYRMFARDLDLDPDVNATPVRLELERRGLWSSADLNYGKVAACRFRDFVVAAEELLAADPWVLVVNRPDKK
jgi:aminoglycoside N3'-acetyltransferase